MSININYIGGNESNYRLRGEPVKLEARTFVGHRPDGDGYEEVWETTSMEERYKSQMRLRGSRKQRAARAMIPTASVTKVKLGEVVNPQVAIARLENREDDAKILELEDRIRKIQDQLIAK